MLWLYLIGLVMVSMITQITILETNVRKLKKDVVRLDSIFEDVQDYVEDLAESVACLDSRCEELEKSVEQTYKTFGQLYNKEVNNDRIES